MGVHLDDFGQGLPDDLSAVAERRRKSEERRRAPVLPPFEFPQGRILSDDLIYESGVEGFDSA